MSQREPFDYIEIDYDFCSRTYGAAPCAAVLGTTGDAKCFNTYFTCQDQANYDNAPKTLKFCKPVANIPVGQSFFPAMLSVSKRTSTVNIGGADDRLSAFGKRASLNVTLADFPYHDRATDKYQAERVSGVAQADAIGYDPEAFGTFFGRLRSRWPYYSGRPIRYVSAYLDGGTITVVKTSHYIITDLEVDGERNRVTIKARDPLDVANNKRALVPQPVNGVLAADISDVAGSLTLSPSGIGDDSYPASGRALIGSEYVAFTRSGDVVTLTERGIERTTAQSHSAGDSFQTAFSVSGARIDTVIKTLLVDFAGLDAAFIPDAAWAAEISRWAPTRLLTADIAKPENVDKIINEIAFLGISVWWDEVTQKVGLKAVRPVDGDTIYSLTDDNAIKEISFEDRDGDRLTEILFSTVLRDPTQQPDEPKNYLRGVYIVDAASKVPEAFADTRYKEINCRFLQDGNIGIARVSAKRLLNRFKLAPRRYRILLDAKDRDIGLTDVLEVQSRHLQDATGRPITTTMQVIEISEVRGGHEFEVIAQAYVFPDRPFYITPNDAPLYSAATDAQKAAFGYIVGPTLKFPDNGSAYAIA